MEVKTFEVRDHGTCIIMIGIRLMARDQREHRLLSHIGINTHDEDYIYLFNPSDSIGSLWPDDQPQLGRTRYLAHQHILKNWDALHNWAVVDVRVETREQETPVESDFK